MPNVETPYSSIVNSPKETRKIRDELAELVDCRDIPKTTTDVLDMSNSDVDDYYNTLHKDRIVTSLQFMCDIIIHRYTETAGEILRGLSKYTVECSDVEEIVCFCGESVCFHGTCAYFHREARFLRRSYVAVRRRRDPCGPP